MTSSARPPRQLHLALGIALFVATVIAFLPALRAGFVSDDFFILARVKAQHGLAGVLAYFQTGFFDYYRPVGFISHAIDWTMWGPDAFGFHLTNIVLHGGSTVLVWRIGRRLMTTTGALVAALLFAWHPAAHEPVFWIAARFDLLATLFGLAALIGLTAETRTRRAAGLLAFALALLSKESAIAVLIMVPAWDVVIKERTWRDTAQRLWPVLVVAVLYAAVRSAGADLAATGGASRVPKLVMAAGAIALILAAATRAGRTLIGSRGARRLLTWPALAVFLGAVITAMLAPVTSGWIWGKLGFVAYAAFYLVSPVIFPLPAPNVFEPARAGDAVYGLVALALGLGVLSAGRRWWSQRPSAVIALIVIAAALLPVSSMTGGLRYLYFASVGVSLLAGLMVDDLTGRLRTAAYLLLVMIMVVSLTQLVRAGRAWQWAGSMTQDAVVLMSGSLAPCGTRDVLLLTAPVGIRGVYSNLYWEAFDVTTGCAPASLAAVLRLMRTDTHVEVSAPRAGVVEIRVPQYAGNLVGSYDLRNFGEAIAHGQVADLETSAGRLETAPEGEGQIFRLTLRDRYRGAELFYFSDGRVRALGTR